jgi:hypothetical protein
MSVYEMARNDTTIAINGRRKEMLQDAAVKVTIAKQKPVKISEIVQHLIDNYLDDATKDMINKI